MNTYEGRRCRETADHEMHPWRDITGLSYMCPGYSWPFPVRPEGWLDDVLDQAHERYKEVPPSMRLVPEMESAANGPSPTPPGGRENRLLRASGWARSAAGKDGSGGLMEVRGSLLADLLDAVAHGTPLPITRAADRLARSLLGEPEVDRG